jgi:hypothetical protein
MTSRLIWAARRIYMKSLIVIAGLVMAVSAASADDQCVNPPVTITVRTCTCISDSNGWNTPVLQVLKSNGEFTSNTIGAVTNVEACVTLISQSALCKQ